MSAYRLTIPNRGRCVLPVNTSYNTEEYVMEHTNMCLIERLMQDQNGGFNCRYRLHTSSPMRFEDTLEYDIGCPRCNGMLRLCGRPVDYYDHGLYKCPTCDNLKKRW